MSEYAELQQQAAESRSLIRSMVMQPHYALPFLQPGRLARVLTSAEQAPAGPDNADAAHHVRAPAAQVCGVATASDWTSRACAFKTCCLGVFKHPYDAASQFEGFPRKSCMLPVTG